MDVEAYTDASDFLQQTQSVLEQDEVANNLMLGLCLRLQRFPERIKTAPYLATVTDEGALVVAAVMTPPHNLVLFSARPECAEALELLAHDLRAGSWHVPGVLGPAAVAEQFAVAWARLAGTSYKIHMQQRIYELRRVILPTPVPGRLRQATEADLEQVTQWVLAFQQEAMDEGTLADALEMAARRISDGDIYLWEEEQPVSMAAKTRPMAHGISVGLVYTPPGLRRRGYATACVAALSQLLLDSGWQFCVLFTNLANPTSNHIYQSIGYRPVCDFDEYSFSG